MHQTFQLYLNLGFIKNPRCTSAGNLLKRKRVIMVNINIYIYIIHRNTHLSTCKGLSSPTPIYIPTPNANGKVKMKERAFHLSGLFRVKYILFGSQVKRNTPFPFSPPRKLFFENRTKHAKISLQLFCLLVSVRFLFLKIVFKI